eukprot:1143847-Pelagomonas_calceolata.AAC.1
MELKLLTPGAHNMVMQDFKANGSAHLSGDTLRECGRAKPWFTHASLLISWPPLQDDCHPIAYTAEMAALRFAFWAMLYFALPASQDGMGIVFRTMVVTAVALLQ